MTNNHARNKRKVEKKRAAKQERLMERMENAWEPEPAWPEVKETEENGEPLGAQGGVGYTADEGTAAAAPAEVKGEGEGPPRRIRKPRTRRGAGERARAAALTALADADNQGLPGSVMATEGVEAGQGLQETADAFWVDPRIQGLQVQHQRELAALEEAVASRDAAAEGREASIKKLEDELAESKVRIRKEENALAIQTQFNDEYQVLLGNEQRAFKKYRDEHEEIIKTAPGNATALAQAQKTLANVTSELKDTADANKQLIAQRDNLMSDIVLLQNANDRLESEVATDRAIIATIADTTNNLDAEIAKVHANFEQAFSDMAKDLTLDEKFAYVREQQEAVAAARLASESSLHDELEETPEPAEHLSFSKIVSVETSPVAAVPAAAAKKPLAFSKISSVDTPPVAAVAPATAAPKKPLSFSGTTSVETEPVALPAAPKQPMSFSGITSIDFAPVAAPVASTPAAAPIAAQKKPFAFSGTTSVDTAPIAAPVVAAPGVAPPATKIVKVYTPVDRYIDRAVVPWWMWLLLLLGLLMCAGGFAGLWREQQIWIAANDIAYQRLMGTSQETWVEWIIMGVEELLPRVGGGGLGHSLFT